MVDDKVHCRPFGKPRRRLEDSISQDFSEGGQRVGFSFLGSVAKNTRGGGLASRALEIVLSTYELRSIDRALRELRDRASAR